MDFEEDKARYLNMNLDEKRAEYHCKSKYVALENIPTWEEYSSKVKKQQLSSILQYFIGIKRYFTGYSKSDSLNKKVSVFVGDITALEVDVIVNAANRSLLGGGGVFSVDGAIHEAAGSKLLAECRTLEGCPTGEAKITGGYKLPAKYVIHTPGPFEVRPKLLKNSYINSLNLAKENGLRSIAFPCISTGVYRYPKKKAAEVVLKTVREFLEQNESSFDHIIFCLFLPIDVGIYESLMLQYFPV